MNEVGIQEFWSWGYLSNVNDCQMGLCVWEWILSEVRWLWCFKCNIGSLRCCGPVVIQPCDRRPDCRMRNRRNKYAGKSHRRSSPTPDTHKKERVEREDDAILKLRIPVDFRQCGTRPIISKEVGFSFVYCGDAFSCAGWISVHKNFDGGRTANSST